jgi:DNA-binding transcriptional LysR family regulator
MLNPRHLASLVAIAEHGGFGAAGAAVGRSHSAISLHVKALEQALGTRLVDRSVRPPVLTADGEALLSEARRLLGVLDDIAALARSDRLAGRLAVGIVPTALTHLAPPALAHLRRAHPEVAISIHAGLSGELAGMVGAGELDAALLTAPDLAPEALRLRPVAEEPLVVAAPADAPEESDAELIAAHPFIWFSRRTWAGQQIERRLLDRGIRARGAMEVDSLEAIEALVRHGLGVAVVPDRTGPGGSAPPGLKFRPFGRPQAVRRLALISRPQNGKARLIEALHAALLASRPRGRQGEQSGG